MKVACALSAFCVVLSFGGSAMAEPYSPACGRMLERISKARKTLLPCRRTIELAKAYEYETYGVAAACLSGDRSSVEKPIRCRRSPWETPRPTKDDLAAVAQYRQKREAFEDLFTQAKQPCLLEP